MQSLVALWVLYRINRFLDLTLEEFQAHYVVKNSPNYEGSYYFQSFSRQVITGRDDSNKIWKDYWFWAGGAWKAPPRVLKKFERFMPTTWNLNKQCRRGVHGIGRCSPMGAQHFRDARREETLPSPDSI